MSCSLRDKINIMMANGRITKFPMPPGAVPMVSMGFKYPRTMRTPYSMIISRYIKSIRAWYRHSTVT